jgi:hypothetical protein
MIIDEFGIRADFGPLWQARIWALERLIFFSCASGDLRWAIIALALRSFVAVCLFGQRHLASWV